MRRKVDLHRDYKTEVTVLYDLPGLPSEKLAEQAYAALMPGAENLLI